MDWYPWHPIVFRRDTIQLTVAQDGIYRRLIDYYMETAAPLPDNLKAILRIAGIDDCYADDATGILQAYFRHEVGIGYIHDFCEKQLAEIMERTEKHREKSKKGADARWSKVRKTNISDATGIAQALPKNATRQDKTRQDTTKLNNFVSSYHEAAGACGLPLLRTLTSSRKSGLSARIKEHGEQSWYEVLAEVNRSSFLKGKNDRNWRCDFDWLINPNNYAKVLEGKYRDIAPQRKESVNNSEMLKQQREQQRREMEQC